MGYPTINSQAASAATPDNSRVWFACPLPGNYERARDSLKVLGVHIYWTRTGKVCTYQRDLETGTILKTIGMIYVNGGEVIARLYLDATTDDRHTLLGAAQDAFTNPPSRKNGWTLSRRSGKSGWRCEILRKVANDGRDTVADAAMRQVPLRHVYEADHETSGQRLERTFQL